MKNNYHFRSILFTLLLSVTFFHSLTLRAQTTLNAGDIAFTLLNMEGNNTDAFSFVLLKAVEAGTVIRITDKEYDSATGFEVNEGLLTLTFEAPFPCGTEVLVTDVNPESGVYDFQAAVAGITTTSLPANAFQLSTSGDALIAFQSDDLITPPLGSFISALANTGVDFGVAASGSGDLPPGLTLGSTAMAMTANSNGDEWDNIKYDCSITENSDLAVLRTAIYTPANWLTDDNDPLPTASCEPTFSCTGTCEVSGFTIPDSISIRNGVVPNLGGASLNGGVYSGPGVVDLGNGFTFSFDPAVAGLGTHTITYTYTNENGCTAMSTEETVVFQVPVSNIADIDEIDVDGVSILSDELVAVQGVVHCIDFSAGDALEFWIMEAGGDGISVFRSVIIDDYVVTEGDELLIEGTLNFFRGLLDINPKYIEVISQGNELNDPIEVSTLNEDLESKWVSLTVGTLDFETTLVDGSGDSRFSIMTDDTTSIDVVVKDITGIGAAFLTDFIQSGTESASVKITGIVSQSDVSSPFYQGYELWPCTQENFELNPVSVNEPGWAADLQLYPNPTTDLLTVNAPLEIEKIRLIDAQGRLLKTVVVNNSQHLLSLQHLPNGVYQLQLLNGTDVVTRRVVKQ